MTERVPDPTQTAIEPACGEAGHVICGECFSRHRELRSPIRKFFLRCSECDQQIRWASVRWGMRYLGHRWNCTRNGEAPNA